MAKQNMISKEAPPLRSMEFQHLWETALSRMQELSGQNWTDHNVHDPGMTMLELFCYALTDLGYRINFDIADLLADRSDPRWEPRDNAFYSAAEILPSAPLTILDYRKILIDLPGVENAWIEKSTQSRQRLFSREVVTKVSAEADAAEDTEKIHHELTYEDGIPITVRGLYDISIELAADPEFGNLNERFFTLETHLNYPSRIDLDLKEVLAKASLSLGGDLEPAASKKSATALALELTPGAAAVKVEFSLPYWDELPREWAEPGDLSLSAMTCSKATKAHEDAPANYYQFHLRIAAQHPANPDVEQCLDGWVHLKAGLDFEELFCQVDHNKLEAQLYALLVPKDSKKRKRPSDVRRCGEPQESGGKENDPSPRELVRKALAGVLRCFQEYLTAHFQQTLQEDLSDKASEFAQELMRHYQRRALRTHTNLGSVRKLLQANRNLGEDFREISTIRIQEIDVSAELLLADYVDAEETVARIYHRLHRFFAPGIQFYSLSEMLKFELPTEVIFEGPLLQHGFIIEEELIRKKQHAVIHTSDLSQVITTVEGVIGTSDIQIQSYINNNLLPPQQEDAAQKSDKSWLTLQDPIRFKARLKTGELNFKVKQYGREIKLDADAVWRRFHDMLAEEDWGKEKRPQSDFTFPAGRNRNLGQYHSIQAMFPATYGIGENELPDAVPTARKAQKMQMKGYLLFFEQLLSSQLSQLANVRKLFSLSPDVQQSYFPQTLLTEEGIRLEFSALFRNMAAEPFDTECGQRLRPARLQRGPEAYLQTLQEETESPGEFQVRRTRFLNHLLARFGHDAETSDILTGLFLAGKSEEEVISDQLKILQQLPLISRSRGTAFNPRAKREDDSPDVWHTGNVSGFQRRLAYLLGLARHDRRGLSGRPDRHYPAIGLAGDKRRCFTLAQIADEKDADWEFSLDMGQQTLLIATKDFQERHAAEEVIAELLEIGRDATNYHFHKIGKGQSPKFGFTIRDGEGRALARHAKPLKSEAEFACTRDRLLEFFQDEHRYVVEPWSGEGFYLLEHLLLRPQVNTQMCGVTVQTPLMPISEAGEDPYSFRVSLIFPGKYGRFADLDYRRFVEQLVLNEFPAHLKADVIWVPFDYNMVRFEAAYRDWLEVEGQAEPFERAAGLEYQQRRIAVSKRLIEELAGLRENAGIGARKVGGVSKEFEGEELQVPGFLYANRGIGTKKVGPDFEVMGEEGGGGIGRMGVGRSFIIQEEKG